MLATTLLLAHTAPAAVDRSAACKLVPIDAMFRVNAGGGALPAALTKPVAAAGGELIHLQIAVAAGAVASGSTVSASVEGLGTVTVRAVGYVNLTLPLPAGNNIGPASKPGLFPDPLVPLQGAGGDVVQLEDHGGEGASLPPRLSPPASFSASLCACVRGCARVCVGEGAPQVFWVTVEVPRTATPGMPHQHLLPCRSFSHTNLKSPCAEPGSHAGKFSAMGCGDVAFSVQVTAPG